MGLARDLEQGVRQGARYAKKLANGMTDLLCDCQNNKTYAAVKVTTVLTDAHYQEIKQTMERLGLWTMEMRDLESAMLPYKYDAA